MEFGGARIGGVCGQVACGLGVAPCLAIRSRNRSHARVVLCQAVRLGLVGLVDYGARTCLPADRPAHETPHNFEVWQSGKGQMAALDINNI